MPVGWKHNWLLEMVRPYKMRLDPVNCFREVWAGSKRYRGSFYDVPFKCTSPLWLQHKIRRRLFNLLCIHSYMIYCGSLWRIHCQITKKKNMVKGKEHGRICAQPSYPLPPMRSHKKHINSHKKKNAGICDVSAQRDTGCAETHQKLSTQSFN